MYRTDVARLQALEFVMTDGGGNWAKAGRRSAFTLLPVFAKELCAMMRPRTRMARTCSSQVGSCRADPPSASSPGTWTLRGHVITKVEELVTALLEA